MSFRKKFSVKPSLASRRSKSQDVSLTEKNVKDESTVDVDIHQSQASCNDETSSVAYASNGTTNDSQQTLVELVTGGRNFEQNSSSTNQNFNATNIDGHSITDELNTKDAVESSSVALTDRLKEKSNAQSNTHSDTDSNTQANTQSNTHSNTDSNTQTNMQPNSNDDIKKSSNKLQKRTKLAPSIKFRPRNKEKTTEKVNTTSSINGLLISSKNNLSKDLNENHIEQKKSRHVSFHLEEKYVNSDVVDNEIPCSIDNENISIVTVNNNTPVAKEKSDSTTFVNGKPNNTAVNNETIHVKNTMLKEIDIEKNDSEISIISADSSENSYKKLLKSISDITGEQNVSSSKTADSNFEALQNINNNEFLENSTSHEKVTNQPQNISGDGSPAHDSLDHDIPAHDSLAHDRLTHDNSDAEEIIAKPKHNYISSQSEEDGIAAKSSLKKKYFKPNVLAKRKHRSSSFSAYSSCDEEVNESSRRKKKKVLKNIDSSSSKEEKNKLKKVRKKRNKEENEKNSKVKKKKKKKEDVALEVNDEEEEVCEKPVKCSAERDLSTLTMQELIHYRPKSFVKVNLRSNATQPNNVETVKEALESCKVSKLKKVKHEEEANDQIAPQLMINEDGQVVIDESSLTIKKKVDDTLLKSSKVLYEDSLTFGNHLRRKNSRGKRWKIDETLRFYKALSQIGTDFTLMSQAFGKFTRNELKKKFKQEERVNCDLVDRALANRLPLNTEMFLRGKEEMQDLLEENKSSAESATSEVDEAIT